MYDYITIETNAPIKDYREDRIKICKELCHWNYLTLDEKAKFNTSTDKNEISRLLATARTRAYSSEIRRL